MNAMPIEDRNKTYLEHSMVIYNFGIFRQPLSSTTVWMSPSNNKKIPINSLISL